MRLDFGMKLSLIGESVWLAQVGVCADCAAGR